jgi:broad specificity phosphatase PhoE
MTMDDYARVYGDMDDPDPDRPVSPGGESRRMYDERIRRATAALFDAYAERTVIVFTHGGFVYGALLQLLGAPGLAVAVPGWQPPANTSLTTFVVDAPGARPLLTRYNDARHLDGYIPG